MTSETSFDLRAEVRHVLDTTSLADPGDVADKVVESVPAVELRRALRATLRALVREVMRHDRAATLDSPSSQTAHDTHLTSAAGGTSWKVTGIRDQFAAQMSARYHVADGWKLLRDMGAADLRAAAAERETLAAENAAAAARLTSWADALDAAGVAVMADLPAVTLAALFGGVA